MIYSSRGFKKDKYQAGGLNLEQLVITEEGNKTCVILLHGIGGSKISLTGLASVFAKKDAAYDLILPDLPGSGSAIKLNFDDQTFRSWFEDYLKINGDKYKKIIIVGHSMGAYQCIINADLINKYCKKLVLVCPVLSLDYIAKTAHGIFSFIGALNKDIATSFVTSSQMIKLSNQIMVKADKKAKSKILNSRLKELDIVNKPSWFSQCQHIQKVISEPDFQLKLSKVSIETLIVGAKKDVIAETNKYTAIAAKLNWQLVISENFGHQLPNEDPDWLATEILKFIG